MSQEIELAGLEQSRCECRVSSGCLKLQQLTVSCKAAGLMMSSPSALDFSALCFAHPVFSADPSRCSMNWFLCNYISCNREYLFPYVSLINRGCMCMFVWWCPLRAWIPVVACAFFAVGILVFASGTSVALSNIWASLVTGL